jgi:mannonate dehydratase
VTSFDYGLIEGATQQLWDPEVSESVTTTDEQMWDNVAYFLKAVIPVAEEAGVRMGLHPDDPPISPIGGIARIFRSHAALKRLLELVPSPSNGLGFCQGTISEMPGNVLDAIRYFGSRDKIFYVHFRNVTGTVPRFSETFIGEGHVNMLEAMRAYQEVGYDGPMIPDHVPVVAGDVSRQYRSHAYAVGYTKALMDVVAGEEGVQRPPE